MTLDLEAIRRRVEAAQEPPWEWCYGDRDAEIMPRRLRAGRYSVLFPNDEDEAPPHLIHGAAADMELIAHAPTDLRALLAEVERLRGENERLRTGLEAANRVMWMAEHYAESGGSGGPEMRDYSEAMEDIRAALEVPRE